MAIDPVERLAEAARALRESVTWGEIYMGDEADELDEALKAYDAWKLQRIINT